MQTSSLAVWRWPVEVEFFDSIIKDLVFGSHAGLQVRGPISAASAVAFTAGFISIGRLLPNGAPVLCLPSGLIGVPYPDIRAPAGSPTCLKQARGSFSHSTFSLQGRQRLTMHAGVCR